MYSNEGSCSECASCGALEVHHLQYSVQQRRKPSGVRVINFCLIINQQLHLVGVQVALVDAVVQNFGFHLLIHVVDVCLRQAQSAHKAFRTSVEQLYKQNVAISHSKKTVESTQNWSV